MSAPRAYECSGEVAVGELGPETRERLAELGGEWLEHEAPNGRIVVRHVQPGGAPALQAVPAELIAMLEALSPEERERVRGGTLLVRDRNGVALRLVVDGGEIRVQWPREDWAHAVEVPVEEALDGVAPASARVTGTLRFEAPPGARAALVDFVERFEGLYPEGDLRLDREGALVRVELRGLNVGPRELLDKLRALARPPQSLAGALEVGSFVPNALERDFRLTIRGGTARAERPALWRDR
jgi:hypothetical protein